MTQQATQSLVGTQVSLSAKRGAGRFSYLLYAATDMTGKSGDQRGVNKLGGIRMGTGSATKEDQCGPCAPGTNDTRNQKKGHPHLHC